MQYTIAVYKEYGTIILVVVEAPAVHLANLIIYLGSRLACDSGSWPEDH